MELEVSKELRDVLSDDDAHDELHELLREGEEGTISVGAKKYKLRRLGSVPKRKRGADSPDTEGSEDD